MKVNDSLYSKEFLQGKIDAAKAGLADVRVPVFTKEKLSTGSSEINSFGMEMKQLSEVRLQLFKGKSGSTDLVNAPVPKKPSGGSNPKDFVNPHSEKHLYDRSRPSTPNRSQYGEDVDVAKLRQETMTSPDKAYSNWPNPNNPNPNKITKYYKEFDGNISTPDTPTGSHRVFENLDNPTRSSHFPYVPRK